MQKGSRIPNDFFYKSDNRLKKEKASGDAGIMKWHLLNQHFVSMESNDSRISVLEEVVSSDQLLVQVLVSGMVSPRTMTLVSHRSFYNQVAPIEQLGVI